MLRDIQNLARRLVNATSNANGRPSFIRLKAEVNKLVKAAENVAKLNVPPPAANVRRQVPRPAPSANVRRQAQRPSNFTLWQGGRAKAENAYRAARAASPEGKAEAAAEAANRARLNATKQTLEKLDTALRTLVRKVAEGVTANNKTTLQTLRAKLNAIRRNAPSNSKNNFNGKNLQMAVVARYLNNENKEIYDAVKSLVGVVAALRGKIWKNSLDFGRNYKLLYNTAPNNSYKNLVQKWRQKVEPRHPPGGYYERLK